LAKCATSAAANYRATCNARSRAEFIAKLGVVVEESDESEFWLDVSGQKGLAEARQTERLRIEAGECRAIFGKSLGTAHANFNLAKISKSTNNKITK
jgi:four helix bundle protein